MTVVFSRQMKSQLVLKPGRPNTVRFALPRFGVAQLSLNLLATERVKGSTLPAQRAIRSHSPGQRPGSSNGLTDLRANGPAILYRGERFFERSALQAWGCCGPRGPRPLALAMRFVRPVGPEPGHSLFERSCSRQRFQRLLYTLLRSRPQRLPRLNTTLTTRSLITLPQSTGSATRASPTRSALATALLRLPVVVHRLGRLRGQRSQVGVEVGVIAGAQILQQPAGHQ